MPIDTVLVGGVITRTKVLRCWEKKNNRMNSSNSNAYDNNNTMKEDRKTKGSNSEYKTMKQTNKVSY